MGEHSENDSFQIRSRKSIKSKQTGFWLILLKLKGIEEKAVSLVSLVAAVWRKLKKK